jgi:putative DNA primase/helicase
MSKLMSLEEANEFYRDEAAKAKLLDEYTDELCDIRLADQRTEMANATRLMARHGDRLRYVPPWKKWVVDVGTHWRIDDGVQVESMARDIVEDVWRASGRLMRQAERSDAQAMLTFAKATASATGMRNMLHLARSEPGASVSPEELDKDPWLLNCINGTVDLRTGKRRPHCKDDLITRLAPVVHSERCEAPLWESFVHEIMGGDKELVGYLRRLCGYWLSGSTREHILPILHGGGANGKSVFLSTLETMLGDYAMHAPPDLLLVKRHESHPTERADLFGKRLVTCVETDAGRRLNEALVKELTGSDRVRARRLYQDHWEFSPTHKLVIASNARPVVVGTDNGIWRRLRLIPFGVTFAPERQDKDLPEKLRREMTGILAWCIRGCLEWQTEGLGEPASIMAATESYRDEQDVLGAFFDERCELGDHASERAGDLYAAYSTWCQANGHDGDNATVFGRKLTERGFAVRKSHGTKVRDGIRLRNYNQNSGDSWG